MAIQDNRVAPDTASGTSDDDEPNLFFAFVLLLPPMGLQGAHHFYLGRPMWGVLYSLTLGYCGLGWFLDLLRLPWLVKHANSDHPNRRTLTEAYILWFNPLGLFGAHHYYLKRGGWGFLYTCTFGCFGIGWLIDGFRMKRLVDEANERNIEKATCWYDIHTD